MLFTCILWTPEMAYWTFTYRENRFYLMLHQYWITKVGISHSRLVTKDHINSFAGGNEKLFCSLLSSKFYKCFCFLIFQLSLLYFKDLKWLPYSVVLVCPLEPLCFGFSQSCPVEICPLTAVILLCCSNSRSPSYDILILWFS